LEAFKLAKKIIFLSDLVLKQPLESWTTLFSRLKVLIARLPINGVNARSNSCPLVVGPWFYAAPSGSGFCALKGSNFRLVISDILTPDQLYRHRYQSLIYH
jgi:hypothetical protein